MPNITVKDAVVFVTGTNRSRGIGRAIVDEMVKRGAKKVYATAKKIANLDHLAAQYPGIVVPLALDLTNSNDFDKVAQEAKDTQILINNAGVAGFSGLCFNYNEQIARQELEVNYFGPLNLIRAFCKTLIQNKPSAIVNVISVVGLSAFPFAATYSAAKAAAHSLTQSVRAELMPLGVSVFGVYPGPIDTDMIDSLDVLKESANNVALRILDGMKRGIEDITTDAFSDDFVKSLSLNPKKVEKESASHAHQMPEGFLG